MKDRILILFLFLIYLLVPKSASANKISGRLNNAADSTYVCLSIINNLNDFFLLGNDMIIKRAKIDVNGRFEININELTNDFRFYRISFTKGSKSIYFTNGKVRNNMTLYLNNTTNIDFELDMKNLSILNVNMNVDNDVCSKLYYIDNYLQDIILKILYNKTYSNAAKTILKDKFSNYATKFTKDLEDSIIKYYLFAYLNYYQMDNVYLTESYISELMQKEYPDSIYTKELKDRSKTDISLLCFFFMFLSTVLIIYSSIISYLYFFRQSNDDAKVVLSFKEKQVLKLIYEGMINKEIAEELSIGLNTVKTHVKSLYKKLNINNRRQASEYYHNSIRG